VRRKDVSLQGQEGERENTYLSGARLATSKQELLRKFDEIVAFAELENFIDRPVKHDSI
jgi:lipopolysaccharide transport system ATP-binding protein